MSELVFEPIATWLVRSIQALDHDGTMPRPTLCLLLRSHRVTVIRGIWMHNVHWQLRGSDTYLVQAETFLFWSPLSIPLQGLELLYFPHIFMDLSIQQSTGTIVEVHAHQQQQGQAKWTPAAQQPAFQQAKHRHLPSWCPLSINLMTKKTAQHSQQPCEQHFLKRKIQMLVGITALKPLVFMSFLINWSHLELGKLEGWGRIHIRNTNVQWITRK